MVAALAMLTLSAPGAHTLGSVPAHLNVRIDLRPLMDLDHYIVSIDLGKVHGDYRIDPFRLHFSLRSVEMRTVWNVGLQKTDLRSWGAFSPSVAVTMPHVPPGPYELTALPSAGFVHPAGRGFAKIGYTSNPVFVYFADTDRFRERSQPERAPAYFGYPDASIVDDPIADSLMKRFGSRPVWLYGDTVFTSYSPSGTPCHVRVRNHAPMQIRSVQRAVNLVANLPLGRELVAYCVGSAKNSCQFNASYDFYTQSPLLVRIDAPANAIEYLPPHAMSAYTPWGPGVCTNPYVVVADQWDFERLFTLDDPRKIGLHESAKWRNAMLAYYVVPGMDREMIAFSQGYPSEFGTAADLNKLTEWDWYLGTPGATQVEFYHDSAGGDDYASKVVQGDIKMESTHRPGHECPWPASPRCRM